MQTAQLPLTTERYASCIEVSKRVRWDIDRDVVRGRSFDFSKKFLPDGLSQVNRLTFLSEDQRRLLGQIQGRTYANMFALTERFIGAKLLELSCEHWLGDQAALEALVRFSDEEIKHQALFRRIEQMIGEGMPMGYTFLPPLNGVAQLVLRKSNWAVLALTCHIELFTQVHYRQSIESDPELSDLFKDVFLFHWKEESQHAILDELEWMREDNRLSYEQRDGAISDFIELLRAVDGLLQLQARADAGYFLKSCGQRFTALQEEELQDGMLYAYRFQYIASGVQDRRFAAILSGMITPGQAARIGAALAPMMS